MSYTIEYARKVFVVPAGTVIPAGFGKVEHSLSENAYYLFHKSGCNNIYPRPQHWHLSAHGRLCQVINKVCEYAGWSEGGELKLPGGNTTPEAYLKMHRKAIAEAELFSIEAMVRATGVYGGYLCLGNKHEKPADWVSKKIKDLNEWSKPYGEYFDCFRYDFNFISLESFRAFVHFSNLTQSMGGFISLLSANNTF